MVLHRFVAVLGLLALLLPAPADAGDLPTPQASPLKPADAHEGDNFGSALACDGDTILVGAELVGPGNEGMAYAFVRDGAGWSQQAAFPGEAVSNGFFGRFVALSGDTAVVGDQPYAPGLPTVAVYVRTGTSWSLQTSLSFDASAVAVIGDTLILGQAGDSPRDIFSAGSATVFARSGTSWSPQTKLAAADPNFGADFGRDLAASGDTLVVAAPEAPAGAEAFAGAAYVFVRVGAQWVQQAKLTAGDASQGARFGTSVAIRGDTIAVGAQSATSTPGVLGGAAYVFVRNGANWTQQAKLVASDPDPQAHFGSAVGVSADALIVGAISADVGTKVDTGAAYLFVRSGTGWAQQAKLTATLPNKGDWFGRTAALSGDTAVVGAMWDKGFGGIASGSALAFEFGAFAEAGAGLAGGQGTPKLVGQGTLLAGSGGKLTLTGAPPSTAAVLLGSLADTPTPFKGGVLHAVPALIQLSLPTSASGAWALPWTAWPAGLPEGTTVCFQAVIADAGAPQGFALSNALVATQP